MRALISGACAAGLVVGSGLWAGAAAAPTGGGSGSGGSGGVQASPACTSTIASDYAKKSSDYWGQHRLGLDDSLWAVTKGAGIKVAVVDTGVDAGNPVFSGGAVTSGASVTTGTLGGDDNGDYDCDGHGTLVAGLIAGRTGKQQGFTGVAPGATIIPIRYAMKSGKFPGGSTNLVNGIRKAIDLHASIINVSVDTSDDSQDLREVVREALAKNILIVAAAGNEGNDGDRFPASIPGVLSVGAVDKGDQASFFSEKNAAVAISAPGSDIGGPVPYFKDSVNVENGTSFACPYVAGVAALVRATHPALTPAQVINRLEATADRPASGLQPDPKLGWGVVNPLRAVTALLPDETDFPAPTAPPPLTPPTAHAAADDGTAGRVAWGVFGAGLLAVVVPCGALTLRQGRARGWRAGG